MPELLLVLKESFGLSAFRPGQEEAIRSALEGKDVIVIMPTGAGKSLCYQLPALLGNGLTLVVSPLIALMKDQVDKLSHRGIASAFINSSLSQREQSLRLREAQAGKYRLLYIAPERFRQRNFTKSLSSLSLVRLVVDEAHCISEWGPDFRPDYLVLGEVRKLLGFPPAMAVTASATPRVQKDILDTLRMKKPKVILTGFDRPSLYFEVRSVADDREKWFALGHFLGQANGPGILYAGTRWASEEAARFCREVLGTSCEAYHAGLEDEERNCVQEDFMSGKLSWVAATSAFGLGVNKEDIRSVVHLALPESLERYYQEVGRAGRDGREARVVLFFGPADEKLSEWMIQTAALTRTELVFLYHTLLGQAKDGHIAISEDELRELAGLSDVKLRLGLQHLEDLGALIGRWSERSRLFGEVLPDAVRLKDLDAFEKKREGRRRLKQEKLSEMVRYAKAEGCRRGFILRYFGEPLRAKPKRCCENCSAARPREFGSPELAILSGIKSLRWKVGRRLLARILKGSKGAKFLLRGYSRAACYRVLKELSAEDLDARIEGLLSQRYLKLVGRRYPVLSLTSKGEEALSRSFLETHAPVSSALSGDIGEQAVVIYRAGIKQEPKAVPLLLSALQSEEARLRALSASALGRIRDSRALKPLLSALNDPMPEVRQYSAKALGSLGDSSALLALRNLVQDSEEVPNTKACAKEAIEAINSGPSLRKHRDALNHENALVILRALDALGGKLTRSMFARLLSGLPGESEYQQRFADSPHRGALRHLAWEEVLEITDVLMALGWIEFGRGRLIRLAPIGKEILQRPNKIEQQLSQPPEKPHPALSSEELDQRIENFLQSQAVKRLKGIFDEGYALGLHGRYVGGTYEHTELGGKVYRFKYGGEKALVEPLSQEVVDFLRRKKFSSKLSSVLAVPSTVRDRPYDPMTLLAEHVAKSLGLADLSQALLKARNTLPQKELTSLAKKRANVRGAFRIARCEAVKGQSLLILDDLYDSGITLNEVCQTVRKAGAKAVYALALTRTIHVEK